MSVRSRGEVLMVLQDPLYLAGAPFNTGASHASADSAGEGGSRARELQARYPYILGLSGGKAIGKSLPAAEGRLLAGEPNCSFQTSHVCTSQRRTWTQPTARLAFSLWFRPGRQQGAGVCLPGTLIRLKAIAFNYYWLLLHISSLHCGLAKERKSLG